MKMNQKTLKLMLLIGVMAGTAMTSQISHCQKQEKSSGKDCCTTCAKGYILNRCFCFSETKYIKFFLTMNHFVFILCFIVLPLVLITYVFVRFKWGAIEKEREDIKTIRLGSPVEFDEGKIFELRDDHVTTLNKENQGNGSEFEMKNNKEKELE